MTGYGKSSCQYKGRVLTLEIRTLNSKQGDLNLRIPAIYREKELEMREVISSHLDRGKIDLSIQRDLADGETATELNESLVDAFYKRLKKLEANMDEESSKNSVDYLSLIMKMPDVLKPAAIELETGEFAALKIALIECLVSVNEFRKQEGAKLESVLANGAKNIKEGLERIIPFEEDRINRIKKRIYNNLGDDAENASFDKDRFEQELIYYLEKLDITEEKVRLEAHCDYFLKTLEEESIKGKKLSFIAQEMGREINTLGSKAQHSEMQRIVVEMKDELEKIKEQALNVL